MPHSSTPIYALAMIPLFLGLTALNLLCLGTACLFVWMSGPGVGADWRRLAELAATMVCCGVHCVVITYFAATAKWVQHAVTVKRLDATLAGPTRSFKAQAFPAAISAIAAAVLAAFTGAAADAYGGRLRAFHLAFALLALTASTIAAVIEHRAIIRNGALIDRILASISTADAQPA